MNKEKNGISYFGINTNGSTSNYTFKVLNIGDWNINSSATKSVAHSLSSSEVKSIKNISVILRDDANTTYYPISSKTSTYSENRFGPTSGLNILSWVKSSDLNTLDQNYNIYFPQTASTTNDFYVNDTYALSAYSGYNYSYVIPKNTGTYTININLFLLLRMYKSQSNPAIRGTPNSVNVDLLCDIILKQGSTVKKTVTYNLGSLPESLNEFTSADEFFISYTDSISTSLNSTDQLYLNIRFYSSGDFRYYYVVTGGPGGGMVIPVASYFKAYTLSNSGGTQSYFGNYISGSDSQIAPTFFNIKATEFFNSTNFNSTSYNRGWISFFYEPD